MSNRREILSSLKQELRDLTELTKNLEQQKVDVEKAIDLLSRATTTPFAQWRRPRTSGAEWQRQILAVLQTQRSKSFSAADLAKLMDAPVSSTLMAVKALLDNGQVLEVGATSQGGSVIEYKPAKVQGR